VAGQLCKCFFETIDHEAKFIDMNYKFLAETQGAQRNTSVNPASLRDIILTQLLYPPF
jgi:hypothetical protein